MQEELEEDPSQQVVRYLYPELDGEGPEVVVQHDQRFSYVFYTVPMAKEASPSRMSLMALNRSLKSKVPGIARLLLLMLERKIPTRSRALTTFSWLLRLVFLKTISTKGLSSF